MTGARLLLACSAWLTLAGCDTVNVDYTVGAMVSGLAGNGLVLQNNHADDLVVGSDGLATFATRLSGGSGYNITVLRQPTIPTQFCTVSNGSGTLGSQGMSLKATVSCSVSAYSVGGTVSGLTGSGLVLQDNGSANTTVTGNGPFAFANGLAAGAAYSVTIATQPTNPSQTCVLGNASGVVGSDNITNVTLVCQTNLGPTYSVSGSVSGLTGSGLILQDDGGDNLPVAANGAFSFATGLASGAAYSVTVATQPSAPSQTCTVTGASGTVGSSNVSTVGVACITNRYSVSGTVAGLAGSGLVLRDNGGDNLTVSGNAGFTFATALASGATYSVAVATQPTNPAQTCRVVNGSGIVGAGNVTGISVACTTNSYTIGGTVSGLAGAGLMLRNNGADSLSVAANGAFTFATAVQSGSPYSVTVATQPGQPNQLCVLSNASGTVSSANITSISLICRTAGRVVYVANNSDDVSVFTINPTTGALTSVAGSPFAAGAGPTAIAVDPSAKFAYVANGIDGTVSAYIIDPHTSALTPVAGSPFPVGVNPQALTVDPSGHFVYVANYNDGTVSAFTLNVATGALTPIAGSPYTTYDWFPRTVVTDPTGQYLYVLNYGGRDMAAYKINTTSGALTALGGTPYLGVTGSGPFSMAITPNGQFAYVANNDGSSHVSGFSINLASGAPNAPLPNSPYFGANLPFAVAIHPSGQFVYVNDKASDLVVGYSINGATGDLVLLPSSPFATHVNPRAIALDPSGQFTYVANADTDDISAYTIDAITGALTDVTGGPFLTDSGPVSIAISQ
jgi:6-phosphogluconolactonase (cycloisomerase 2 family)